MKISFKGLQYFVLISLLFSSCATYHITTQSLVEQLANTHKENKKLLVIAFPFFIPFTVEGNSLSEIKVLDINEKEKNIFVTNHTGIRITKKDGKRKTFYFNTLILKDSLVTGKVDHFLGVNINPINLNNIEKIELQN
ncbi:hypothetical protein [Flavobacterium sp.]|uniref:hypothetical protein n=1 Tax=Flavobacterium sp. TaxID=239 RepID=UPI0037BDA033